MKPTTTKFQTIRFSCGPSEVIGDISLRGSERAVSYYRTIAIEVFPLTNRAGCAHREAVAVPCESP